MNNKSLIFIMVVSFLAVFMGCQPTSQGSKTYKAGQAQTAQSVYYGTVLNVADVQIQHEETGAGAVGGAVVGGIVGSTVGGGRGRKLATTAGALGGAAAGSAAEQARAMRPGVEIELEVDDGRILVVVQEKDDEYAVGDRVRLIQSPDGTMRVRQ